MTSLDEREGMTSLGEMTSVGERERMTSLCEMTSLTGMTSLLFWEPCVLGVYDGPPDGSGCQVCRDCQRVDPGPGTENLSPRAGLIGGHMD